MPHEHHAEMDVAEHYIEHKEASDIIDYLKLTLHLDVGGNHLDNFETSSQIDVPFPLLKMVTCFVSNEVLEIEDETVARTYAFINQHSPREYFWNEASYRGPPVV